MTKLSVNVNKLATLRNARGKNNPDVIAESLRIVEFGAHGITVHPRPDERHIRRSDVFALKKALEESGALKKGIEFNIEGYPSEDFLSMIEEVKPDQCTLVPDPPEALTSNAGWLVQPNAMLLAKVAFRLRKASVRTSIFIDPKTMQPEDYMTLAKAGVARIELYTEAYAETYGTARAAHVLSEYKASADLAKKAGLGINAGHDLSLENLRDLVRAIPSIDEVSIGHALICDALRLGLETSVKQYLECLRA